MKTLETFVTNTWRSFKNVYTISGVRNLPIVNSATAYGSGLLINLLAKRKRMALFQDDLWGTKLRMLLRWYEHDTVLIAKTLLRPGMNVLDIGAHIGYFTRLFSELVGPNGTVYAFEPDEETFRLLKNNILFCKYKNVIPVQKAISNRESRSEFFEFGIIGSGGHSLFNFSKYDSKVPCKRQLVVETVTVDDFLAGEGNPEIDFIKMDIEGAEPLALAGMSETVARSQNLILIVEFNARTLRSGGFDPKEYIPLLQTLGFGVRAIMPGGRLCDIDSSVYDLAEKGYVNLLCLKNELT